MIWLQLVQLLNELILGINPGRINLNLNDLTGVAVGDSMTVTTAQGAVTGTVLKFIGSTSVKLKVVSQNRPSGTLLLPKGSPVA